MFRNILCLDVLTHCLPLFSSVACAFWFIAKDFENKGLFLNEQANKYISIMVS